MALVPATTHGLQQQVVNSHQLNSLSQDDVLNEVRFMHAKISTHFSGCGRSILSTLDDIRSGRTSVTDLPMILVMINDLVSSASNMEGKRKQRSKKGKRRGQGGDTAENAVEISSTDVPKYFSLNNRRLVCVCSMLFFCCALYL